MSDRWRQHMTQEVYDFLMMVRMLGVDMRYDPNRFKFVLFRDGVEVIHD